jgi:hypothetical protein
MPPLPGLPWLPTLTPPALPDIPGVRHDPLPDPLPGLADLPASLGRAVAVEIMLRYGDESVAPGR